MALYALVGERSGDVLTYGGRVILHNSKSEMEFLFPNNRVIEFKPRGGDLVMRLADHPDMAPVRFPLNKADFRR